MHKKNKNGTLQFTKDKQVRICKITQILETQIQTLKLYMHFIIIYIYMQYINKLFNSRYYIKYLNKDKQATIYIKQTINIELFRCS